MRFGDAAIRKQDEDSRFAEWLRGNLPIGQRRTYLGREAVVISHRWTNGYDLSGTGAVVEYRDDAGIIHRAEYRFADECMAFRDSSCIGVLHSFGGEPK